MKIFFLSFSVFALALAIPKQGDNVNDDSERAASCASITAFYTSLGQQVYFKSIFDIFSNRLLFVGERMRI
jgi:hypothetical protein